MKPLSRAWPRLLAFASLSLALNGFGAATTEPASTQAGPSPITSTEQSLSAKVPEFQATHEQLDHVLLRLAKTANINVDVQWDDIAASGISRATAVDIRLRDVDARRVLFFVLEAAATSSKVTDPLKKSDFEITDQGNVLIDSREQMCLKHASQHRYDLAPLLKKSVADPNQFMNDMAKLIEDSVNSPYWAKNLCGPPKVDGTSLIVLQTDQNQRTTASVLEQLARNRTKPDR